MECLSAKDKEGEIPFFLRISEISKRAKEILVGVNRRDKEKGGLLFRHLKKGVLVRLYETSL